MEKYNGGLFHKKFWSVITALLLFLMVILYTDFSNSITSNKTEIQLSSEDYVHSILGIYQHPDEYDERVTQSPNVDNEEESIRKISVSVNRNESVTALPANENGLQTVDEAEAVQATYGTETYSEKLQPVADPCLGKYIYVHNLPSKFNNDLLKDCRSLCNWMDMCLALSNGGLGQEIDNSQGVFLRKGWYKTDQFALDVIFHNRMKQYKCLTQNSSLASAIYVPFYAGFDIARHLMGFNISVRDATSHELLRWLTSRPEWKVLGGRDHFLAGGRITMDFRRMTDTDSDWGTNLLNTPEAKNMSTLLIESSPWRNNDFAIPYPTYFHPSADEEVLQWQERMRKQEKPYLFSFAGAPRPHQSRSIRSRIINQCQVSMKCKLLGCNKGGMDKDICHNPSSVMKLFQDSVFCLQPPGDSYTRRSTFDSILAGCVPVFFHPASAYTQYTWHLPRNYTKYSVLIPEYEIKDGKANIEQILSKISKEEIRAMKEEVIKLIPKVIYADPRSRLETIEDAFDLAVTGVIQRVNEVRQISNASCALAEYQNWKCSFIGTEGVHDWDHFF